MTKIIVLEAGHGLDTLARRTPDGIPEWVLNNEVCNKIQQYLEDYDVKVKRLDDLTGHEDISLKRKKQVLKNEKADLYVSIHHNASSDVFTDVSGVETYYAVEKWKSLGQMFVDELSEQTQLNNRGTHSGNFYLLDLQTIPSILCEGGFMNGNQDSYYVRSNQGTTDYAKAVSDVIVSYLHLVKEDKKQIYRVRKSKDDVSSQIAAFSNLDNAIAIAKANKGYKVFDIDGNQVYPVRDLRGKKIDIKNGPLYFSANAKEPTKYINGTYYLIDDVDTDGRYRITNNIDLIGVTGWIEDINL